MLKGDSLALSRNRIEGLPRDKDERFGIRSKWQSVDPEPPRQLLWLSHEGA